MNLGIVQMPSMNICGRLDICGNASSSSSNEEGTLKIFKRDEKKCKNRSSLP